MQLRSAAACGCGSLTLYLTLILHWPWWSHQGNQLPHSSPQLRAVNSHQFTPAPQSMRTTCLLDQELFALLWTDTFLSPTWNYRAGFPAMSATACRTMSTARPLPHSNDISFAVRRATHVRPAKSVARCQVLACRLKFTVKDPAPLALCTMKSISY